MKERTLTYQGVTLTKPEWAERLGLKMGTLYARLNRWGTERALAMGPALERSDSRWRPGISPQLPPETMSDEPGCRICHLRGEHECLRGDAAAGLGQWHGSGWAGL